MRIVGKYLVFAVTLLGILCVHGIEVIAYEHDKCCRGGIAAIPWKHDKCRVPLSVYCQGL